MNNSFIYFLALITILKILLYSVVAIKIDTTISLINEKLLADCVDEMSKYDVLEREDIYFLDIDKDKLKSMCNTILDSNLNFCTYKINYYFYNSQTTNKTPVTNYNNSVQIKLTITYEKVNYERIIRYEPQAV